MKLFKSLVFLVALGVSASEAWAAQASATALFDWSSFSVASYPLGPGSGPSVSGTALSTIIHAETVSPSSFMTLNSPDWTSSLATGLIGASSTQAIGAASPSNGLGVIAADTNPSSVSIAFANANRSATYTVTGSGFLLFSVNYAISAMLQPGSLAPNYASSIAQLSLVKGSLETKATDSINLTSLNTVTRSGTLSLAVFVQNGDVFSFSALTEAKAAVSEVPAPSALLLFGSAMLGFLGLNRRKMH